MDPIHCTAEDILCYKGGVNGHYVRICGGGWVEIGTYQGAYPHIGEALFEQQGRKKFDSQEIAAAWIIEKTGVGVVLDCVG